MAQLWHRGDKQQKPNKYIRNRPQGWSCGAKCTVTYISIAFFSTGMLNYSFIEQILDYCNKVLIWIFLFSVGVRWDYAYRCYNMWLHIVLTTLAQIWQNRIFRQPRLFRSTTPRGASDYNVPNPSAHSLRLVCGLSTPHHLIFAAERQESCPTVLLRGC